MVQIDVLDFATKKGSEERFQGLSFRVFVVFQKLLEAELTASASEKESSMKQRENLISRII